MTSDPNARLADTHLALSETETVLGLLQNVRVEHHTQEMSIQRKMEEAKSNGFFQAADMVARNAFLETRLEDKDFDAFVKPLSEELTLRRVALLESETFLEDLKDSSRAPYAAILFSGLDLDKEKVFIRAWLKGFHYFVRYYRASFSAAQVQELWQTFKVAVTFINPRWVIDPDAMESMEASGNASNVLTRLVIPEDLKAFFTCINASEELLAEISFFMRESSYPTHSGLVPMTRLSSSMKDVYTSQIGIKAMPRAVKTLNPTLFNQQLQRAKVDSNVVNVLISSWTGSFESFIESAKTLSAES